jgi:hypothetical protein
LGRRPGFLVAVLVFAGTALAADPSTTLYDPSPKANALHAALFLRVSKEGTLYGEDRVDPLYWQDTLHLLEGESHERAISALDGFLRDPQAAARLSTAQRALLQNDLWKLFNWAAAYDTPRYEWQMTEQIRKHRPQALALMERLGDAIKRLALTKEQADALPDLIAVQAASAKSSGLPNFDDPKSGWIPIARKDDQPAAPTHLRSFEGRSTFTVYLRLPKGREQTLKYLAALDAFPHPLTDDKSRRAGSHFMPDDPPWLVNDLPVMPIGTQFALVRRLVVLDADGMPRPTRLAQTVQIRTIREEAAKFGPMKQDFVEYALRRPALFAGGAAPLEAESPDATDFSFFMPNLADGLETKPYSHRDRDPLIWPPPVYGCIGCHSSNGSDSAIYTMNSFMQSFAPEQAPFPIRFQEGETAALQNVDVRKSLSRYDRGVLRQWLRNSPPPK